MLPFFRYSILFASALSVAALPSPPQFEQLPSIPLCKLRFLKLLNLLILTFLFSMLNASYYPNVQ